MNHRGLLLLYPQSNRKNVHLGPIGVDSVLLGPEEWIPGYSRGSGAKAPISRIDTDIFLQMWNVEGHPTTIGLILVETVK